MAYGIANARKELQTVLVLLIMMPTWTAILIVPIILFNRSQAKEMEGKE